MGATRSRKLRALATCLAALLSSAAWGQAARGQGCADPAHPGGDWPLYSRDLSGTRNQTDEHVISPQNVGGLRPAWAVRSTAVGATGGFNSTAVVAEGCVYVATIEGWILALNADTGDLAWKTRVEVGPQFGGPVYALAVADGRVHANLARTHPQVGSAPVGVALDAHTGQLLWTSEPIHFGYATGAVASPIVFNGLHLLPTQGPDADPKARPGVAILDAATGRVLAKSTTIPEADLDRGFAGGGIWATPVVDPEAGYAYVGTANPYAKQYEHEYDNAIVKIDVRPDRPTAARVVDAYKGNVDQYIPGLDRQPACDMLPDAVYYHPAGFSATCVQLDIDFGGSPTMWRDSRGRLLVGELQKSGVFHAVRADTMTQAWTTILSLPPTATYTAGNASSAANDGRNVYVVANPGVLFSLSGTTGRINWAAPVADLADYHPVSLANGVVYTIGNHGTLLAYDAATGLPLLARSMNADVGGDACIPLGGGVSIARNTVYAVCDSGADGGGWVIAYRL